ncbi:hypothetical protein HRbin31_00500 [bacterium HR31]|nr:hypothetical protein HRbin31_00500 [bacterium HR31]
MTRAALRPDPAALHLHQVLGDGQAQAGAPAGAGAGAVCAVEAFEHVRQVVRGDAPAGVRHRDPDLRALATDLHVDAPALGGELEGVVHQVGEHLLYTVRIRQHHAAGFRGAGELHPCTFRPGLLTAHQGAAQLPEVHRLEAEGDPFRLQPRELQQVVHQLGESVGLGLDDLQEAPAVLLVAKGSRQEGLREPLDGREGRAQLVGHVGHQLPPQPLGPSQLRDVPDHRHRACGLGVAADRAAGHLHHPPAGQRQFLRLFLPTGRGFQQLR